MPVVRGRERVVAERGDALPTLQRLVAREDGSDAVTVLINEFQGEQRVPEHRHDVEEVLIVTRGTCTFLLDTEYVDAAAGDAIIVPPHTLHDISHTGDEPATVVAVLASPDVQIRAVR